MIRGSYTLDPETEERLRRHWLKLIGACFLVLVFYVLAISVSGVRTGQGLATILDAGTVLAILLLVSRYSRGYAALRIALAKERQSESRHDSVVALLAPFIGRKARFDPSGESFRILLASAQALKEPELAELCRKALDRAR